MPPSSPRGRSSIAQRLGASRPSAGQTGTLYKAFRPYFEFLLHPEHVGEDQDEFRASYVPNPAVEDALQSFIDAGRNAIAALVGPRGIGKSTLLRYVFGLQSSPSLFNNQTVVIPFYIDTIQTKFSSPDQVIISQLLAATRLIISTSPVTITDDRLCAFIRSHKSQLLETLDLPRDALDRDRLEHLKKRNPYAAVAEELKYCVAHSDINRVILLVDDIESAPFSDQKALVQGVLKFRDCLKNSGGRRRTYTADFIFTCRVPTYEMLRNDSEINGFNIKRNIRLDRPVDLNEIIRKRFDLAVAELGPGRIGAIREQRSSVDPAAWEQAYSVLMERLRVTTDRQGPIVTDLCNYNIRDAMTEVNNVLINSRWYEKSTPIEGAFDIHEENYRTSEAGFFRALILKDKDVFSRHNDTIVGNYFYNIEDEFESDLMTTYIGRYLVKRYSSGQLIPVSRIKAALSICYDTNTIDSCFDEIIEYMKQNGMIEIDDKLKDDKSGFERVAYATSQLFSVWQILERTCIFSEFFRDDTFLEHRQIFNLGGSRLCGTAQLNSLERFIAVSYFIEEIYHAEVGVRSRVPIGRMNEFHRYFGQATITKILSKGLSKSILAYYGMAAGGDAAREIPERLTKRLRDLYATVRESKYRMQKKVFRRKQKNIQ